MKTTWEKDWKARKPTTLLGETLSPALKKVDEQLLRFKSDSSSSSVANVTEACAAALKAAEATKAKCNKVIHKDGIKLIESIETDLKQTQAQFSAIERDIQAFYTQVKKIVVPMRQALTAFLSDALPGKIPATIASVKKLSKDFDALKRPVGLTDVEATQAVSSFFGAVTTSLEGIEKTATKLKAAKPGTPEVDELKHQWVAGLKEVQDQTKKGVDTLKKTNAAKRYDLSPG